MLCDRVYLSVVLYNNGIEEKEADRQESLQLFFVAVSFFFFFGPRLFVLHLSDGLKR